MRNYSLNANLVRAFEYLYKAINAVQMNCSTGKWFKTTVGVRQGCLLSLTLFNTFLGKVISNALSEDSIGGRSKTNLQFADNTDALAEEEQELEALADSLDKSRKENPQKLTQLSSRFHPRHLVGKRTAQKDTIIDITSDSQVNSKFPNRWSSASLTFNNYFYLFSYLYITWITINNNAPHLKSPKNQNRRAALGRQAIKITGGLQKPAQNLKRTQVL